MTEANAFAILYTGTWGAAVSDELEQAAYQTLRENASVGCVRCGVKLLRKNSKYCKPCSHIVLKERKHKYRKQRMQNKRT